MLPFLQGKHLTAFSVVFSLLNISSSYKLCFCWGKFFIYWFFSFYYSTYNRPWYGLCRWSFILFAIFLFLNVSNLICAFKCISPSTEIVFRPLNVFSHTCFCHYVFFRLPLLQYYQTRAIDSSSFLCCGFSLNSHRYNSAETEIKHFKVLRSIFFQKPVLVFMWMCFNKYFSSFWKCCE